MATVPLACQGAFQGKPPREAYFVKCDRETTTQTERLSPAHTSPSCRWYSFVCALEGARVSHVGAFLQNLFRINLSFVNILVGFAPLKPAESS
jgi:hypothetical protein